MRNYVEGKVVLVTGAGSGLGQRTAALAAANGASLVCLDIDEKAVQATVDSILAEGGRAIAARADVTSLADMQQAVRTAVDTFGRVDVIVNNAGTMPLAFYADHAAAAPAWSRCIDINIKGVLHGIIAVYDQMIAQGDGHIVNLSSIYGNFPVVGAGVYGASKAAVNFLSDALRKETQGKIRVTTIRPTGCPATNLSGGIINADALVGILGPDTESYLAEVDGLQNPDAPDHLKSEASIGYLALDPRYIAEAIVDAINKPLGVCVSDVTMRATGDRYIL